MNVRKIAGTNVWGKMNVISVTPNGKEVYSPYFYVGDVSITGKDGFILVMDIASQQNSTAFEQGLEYIAKYASPSKQEKVLDILKALQETTDKTSQRYCSNVAFICDLGLWKQKNLCIPNLWHKDFQKYMANVMWNYEQVLY